ncbi:hypothetical protein RUM43_005401 [Polyplax serrata]|uniref:PIN domain-containing protein n=1 Tax=Polyplax serrata TaxID=468196 RepID=A0AAN8PJ07_POLSC
MFSKLSDRNPSMGPRADPRGKKTKATNFSTFINQDYTNLEPGYRSAVQENALIISLQMFNLILEKCVSLLCKQLDNPIEMKNRLVVDDVDVLLPAIKVWCDWLICHVNVWNPPPSCSEYRVGSAGDAWNRLALLVNLLEKLDHRKTTLATAHKEGLEVVRLPEDATLTGFTPLMLSDQDQIYTSSKNDMELAQCCLRIRKILFVGTVFLCGTEPPVLKVQKYDNYTEYVSVVDSSGHSQSSPTEDQSDAELVVESFSEEESDDQLNNSDDKSKTEPPLSLDSLEMATSPSAVETRRLLIRKEELEKKHQRQERHRKRVQAILQQSGLSVVIEVKPKYLVPDTNCFIDYLELLKKIATSCAPGMEPYYILTIPLIVLNELEGLARGGRDRDLSHLSRTEQEHAADVSGSARTALSYLRSPPRSLPTIRCVTTRGKFINSFTTFVVEDDIDKDLKNDDRVLATCISLCRNSGKEQTKPGDPRHLVRKVVLLTEDRNLRVKALARDVPVREVPDFAQWAGLG